jgi:hypothetical protein
LISAASTWEGLSTPAAMAAAIAPVAPAPFSRVLRNASIRVTPMVCDARSAEADGKASYDSIRSDSSGQLVVVERDVPGLVPTLAGKAGTTSLVLIEK